jgi:hypothetical protein
MFVEVNSRRTGKTARLIEAAVKCLCKENTVCMIAPSQERLTELEIRLKLEFKKRKLEFPEKSCYFMTNMSWREDFTQFIDEFDHFEEAHFGTRKTLHITENAYYCGTITQNTNFTKELLEVWKKESDPIEIVLRKIKQEIK